MSLTLGPIAILGFGLLIWLALGSLLLALSSSMRIISPDTADKLTSKARINSPGMQQVNVSNADEIA
jgi:hypothetical protein